MLDAMRRMEKFTSRKLSMGDKSRFSDSHLKMVKSPNFDGGAMIALSRAILRNNYTDMEYNLDFFSIFILIDEESGYIILDGYGEFNTPSERATLTQSHIENTINIMSSERAFIDCRSNTKIFSEEIQDIERSYNDQFHSSLQEFRCYFQI